MTIYNQINDPLTHCNTWSFYVRITMYIKTHSAQGSVTSQLTSNRSEVYLTWHQSKASCNSLTPSLPPPTLQRATPSVVMMVATPSHNLNAYEMLLSPRLLHSTPPGRLHYLTLTVVLLAKVLINRVICIFVG